MITEKASKPASGSTCAGCNKSLVSLSGLLSRRTPYVEVGGRRYHKACLTCAFCHGGISSAACQGADDLLYHPQCSIQKFALSCDCCKRRIPTQV